MSFRVCRLSAVGLVACLFATGARAGEASIFGNNAPQAKEDNTPPIDKDELAVYEKHQQAVLAVARVKNGMAAQEEALKKALDALAAEKKAAFAKEDLDAASAAQAKIEAKRKEAEALGQAVAGKEEGLRKIRELRDQVRQTVTAKKNALINENLEAAKACKDRIEGLKAEVDAQLRLLAPLEGNASAPPAGVAGGFAVFKDREVEVAANNAQGVSLGKIEKGSLVTVEYVGGKWSCENNRRNPESPVEAADAYHLLKMKGIAVIHPRLLKDGFSWRATENLEDLRLCMNDGPDWFPDNAGSVKLKVSVADPKQGVLKPGVLEDRKRWFKGFWLRYDNGSTTPWGPVWCFSAGGDAVIRNRDGSKNADLGDWAMDPYGEIVWQEGNYLGHAFVDSARKAHGYYIHGENGSMIPFELKSWSPPKPAEFGPTIKVGR